MTIRWRAQCNGNLEWVESGQGLRLWWSWYLVEHDQYGYFGGGGDDEYDSGGDGLTMQNKAKAG